MKTFKYIFYVSIALFLFTTCKKKTTIIVKVFNPALNEYVEGAVVSLLEIKQGSFLVKGDCNEIATATTDVNGVATFDKEKLRTASKYKYKLAIKESWGIAHQDPCGSAREDYIDVGKSQEIQLSDYLEIEYKVRCNNVFNPGINGDSIRVDVAPMIYYDPMIGHTQGGGGGNTVLITYDLSFPFPSVYNTSLTKIFANRLVVTTRKRKLGVVSLSIDTVRAYPSNGITIIDINW